jgi:hypothetical protein
MRRAPPDLIADRAIIAVRHPGLGADRFAHAADELRRIVPGQVAPARLPVDCIELDVRHAQPRGDAA